MPINDKDTAMFNTHCKPEFEKIHQAITELDKRIFKDNGSACLQTKIDRNTRWIKTVVGFGAVLWVGIIGLGFKWLWSLIQ